MLRGYYTAASGMLAQQRRQEALSNNIANAQTPGYKQDQATLKAFPELLLQRMEEQNVPTSRNLSRAMPTTIGSINSGVYVQENIPDFSQGDLQETGISTDMALVNGNLPDENGSLFFTLQNGEGEERLSRNGNFTVDGDGFLVSNQGFYVLDQAGNPIQTNNMEFNVTEEGTVQIDGQNIPLGIAYAADANSLIKEGENVFQMAEGVDPAVDGRAAAGVTFSVQQGALEGSNVDSLRSMTDMMEAYRSFETNQKVLKAYDSSMEKAVNEIGRVR
ncbi:flagellar hook-basal body complex protein [Sediminibacillus dalangtanensis]|uniref:Flagellar hook-basal body complex protein n=1 Tax=Sediminibacillus dalangtanensis TaxID=2729421 RepID=A0ABX7VV26_9BACI|nr:flagellar hook-basal body protein [Sediminibacillus dalangtanensis]QTN00835.1 flagellar hook-basal body complex protein [Sediminibacillus dalangtanensis]